MSEFEIYLKLGFSHITDLQAYDHMLFLLALCAGLSLSRWRPVLWLATAFTLGHSLTLGLAALDVVSPDPAVVEPLILVTIILTAVLNLVFSQKGNNKQRWQYFIPFFFGLIHGLGFSGYLKMLLMGEESVVWPLFSFNVGIELGQLLVIALILVVTWAIQKGLKLQSKYLTWALSGISGAWALVLLIQSYT